MLRALSLSICVANLATLVLAGVPAAQAPTEPTPPPVPAPAPQVPPGQPAPVPPPPTGPAVPTPPPPAKEEEPEVPAPQETVIEPQPEPEDVLPSRAPTLLGPNVFIGPDLFNPPAPQGWMSLTPTFTLSGGYNDNLFLTSRDRTSDIWLGFIPGGTLSIQRPRYRLLAGYNVEGQLFLQESDLNDFGTRHQFFADAFYQVAPLVTFTLADRFVFGQSATEVTTGAVSGGREDAWRNTLTPRLRWQATPTTAFRAVASYTVLRFQEAGSEDSDTYRAGLGLDHRFTARLGGTLDLGAAYFNFEREPEAFTVTPRLGLGYELTRTLRAFVSAGPSFVDRDGDQDIRPAVTAGVSQLFKFGSLRIGYDRSVAAETVGISDRQTVFAALVVPTLRRGLQLSFIPRYSIVDTDLAGSDRQIDTLTLNLRATYQIARNISLIGSYTFFHQKEDRTDDIDQNRVFFGLQYAFPINFY